MKPLPLVLSALSVLLALGALAATLIGSGAPVERALAAPGELPNGAVEILAAYPFVLDEPWVHEWRVEKPLVSAGYLLALAVEPELARARQTYEAVLYVGDQTAERCNAPEDGGCLIALVPAAPAPDGGVALDLATTPIWFGSLELPERVDAARIASERAQARRRGIGPARRGSGVSLATGPRDVIHVRSRLELEAYVAELAERFSVR